jgi:hypothetical protein
MTLKSLAKKKLLQEIKNIPPVLLDEISDDIKQTRIDQIKKKTVTDFLKRLKSEANIVISDITQLIISSHRSGMNWVRPSYMDNIDHRLYGIYVNIAENFAQEYYKNSIIIRNRLNYNSDMEVDLEEEYNQFISFE